MVDDNRRSLSQTISIEWILPSDVIDSEKWDLEYKVRENEKRDDGRL